MHAITAYAKRRLFGPAPLLLLAPLNVGMFFAFVMVLDRPSDLGVFIASGHALAEGKPPYAVLGTNNMSGPSSLPVYHLLAALDGPEVRAYWFALSVALYLLALPLMGRAFPKLASPLRLAWATTQGGFLATLATGQVYTLLLPPLAVAYWALDRNRPVVAGLAAGFVIGFKPNLGFWPVLLLIAGHRRPALALLAGAAAWCAVAALLYGPGIYPQYLSMVNGRLGYELEVFQNLSLPSLVYKLGFTEAGALPGLFLLALAALWAWRERPDLYRASAVALLASILASPSGWIGYVCLLVPALLARPLNRPLVAGMVALALPIWLLPLPGLLAWQIWTYLSLLAYLCLGVGFLRQPRA